MNNDTNVEIDVLIPFTNFTDEEFKAKWNNIEYTFPANKRVPMATLIPGETQDGIRTIRAKFAKELAEKVWYQSEKFQHMNIVPPGGVPALYTDSDIAPFVQRCLEPLPVSRAVSSPVPRNSEDNYRKDRKGRNVTKVLDEDESLMGNGSVLAE